MTPEEEVRAGQRFPFGMNWESFLNSVDNGRISEAMRSLMDMLEAPSLKGKSFLDAGCGSGLFSLAARRLGARVLSFDYDPSSVACTRELRRRFHFDDPEWTVEQGSVLDIDYLRSLGEFDIVYSWGVLHHTGKMYEAIDNLAALTRPGGTFFIAIYNYMGAASTRWRWIKRQYCSLPRALQLPFAIAVIASSQVRSALAYSVQGKVKEFARERVEYRKRRGMSWWHDQLDWIGGYPYEDAKPEEVFGFCRARGFDLCRLTTNGGGIGCNQFVFRRTDSSGPAQAR